jgi:hypothetical protein
MTLSEGVLLRAQVSLEYLLLFAAFFAALAVLLPVMNQTSKAFLSASDSLLAKRIASEVFEEVSLMEFLSDGSKKVFEYYPINSISVYSKGNSVFFESSEKTYSVQTNSIQIIPKVDFNSKFFVTLKKDKNTISISASVS